MSYKGQGVIKCKHIKLDLKFLFGPIPKRGSAFFVILIFVKPAVMAGFKVYDRVVNGVFYAGYCFNGAGV